VKYDCLIIGGGLSGLTCGIKCIKEGLRTLLISGGMNSLHFSSGSIDLIGYNSKGETTQKPFDHIRKFIKKNPGHPYSKIGDKNIKESLEFFRQEIGEENLKLYNNEDKNHFHITSLGTMKPTYFSQVSVFNSRLREAFKRKAKIALMNFNGFRDYFPEMALENLKRNTLMNDIEITIGKIKLPYYTRTLKNLHEFRSIDLARIFDSEKYLPRIADDIKKAAGDAEIIGFPAFIGINNFNYIHRRLEEMTGLLIYEGPSLPPSILGMRLDNALRARFAYLGGELSMGDKVVSGEIKNGIVKYVNTANYGDTKHLSEFFVLSTGSFFSGGLISDVNSMQEPIFNLNFSGNPKRKAWYSDEFFDRKSHPFFDGIIFR